MNFFDVLSLFGGLALFLFGMTYMGNGLEKSAGGALERVLEKMTNNPLKGVALGLIVTAVIQSSSATTVMVVGFVNSGIMKLTQAIGIIMGANIGTTVTAWILTLSGLEGDAWYIQIFKSTNLAAIAALIGLIMMMACKNNKKKDIGGILLGFAILMFGMDMMSGAVEPLKSSQSFADLLLLFTNPVFGVLAGAILTAIIQSSSASVGILQALSATGKLPFMAAIPIIMGQNIGTCVTAMLSAIGASKNAKRTAFVHLYFNIIGTIIFLAGFYTLNAFIDFGFPEQINSTHIAIIHTVFNLVTTTILLPFYKGLGKLAELTVRDSNKKVQVNTVEEQPLLDERFLQTPSFALEQCVTVMGKMAELSVDSINTAMDLVEAYTDAKAEEIREIENVVDKYEDRLGTYLVKLSSKNLSIEDSKTATRLLHNIGDLERISDHAVNIQEAAKEMSEKGITFSQEAQKELRTISMAVSEILALTVDSLIRNDLHAATHVEPLEQVIDDLKEKIREKHIDRLQGGKCTIELGFILSDLLTNYERVSDHCSNIAACMIKAAEQSYDMHKYLSDLKSEHSFMDEYRACSEKYAID
ncbi:MAG: Na/Pi cotransporter family protein [Clostridia bacterium]|nr:Na/Pi cotransporter family protein [Clostridia bacterium]